MTTFRHDVALHKRGGDRYHALLEYVKTPHVKLHVGCADAGADDWKSNLHLQLLETPGAHNIDGLDTDPDAVEALLDEMAVRGYDDPVYTSIADCVHQKYDVVLVPEVIEHIGDVATFLQQLGTIDCHQFVFTTPNVCGARMYDIGYWHGNQWIEQVHEDHNYWFSPYTLANVFKKYTDWELHELFTLEEDRTLLARLIR